MTKTYTQAEVEKQFDDKFCFDLQGKPTLYTNRDQTEEIKQFINEIIATTRRETVEECYVLAEDRLIAIQEMGASSDYKSGVVDIFIILKKHLDQLPDKQEV